MNERDETIDRIPNQSGCYIYKNADGKVIYVGKAKNLKNRVRSYRNKGLNNKTIKLVSEIREIDFIVTNTEKEALVLEINLIKQHLPRYNLALVDNKTYPYIVITNHLHPMLLVTRDKTKIKGKYYGPYPHVTVARDNVKLLNKLYPLRKCRKIPKEECLYYHMHQCLAPCVKKTR